MTFVHSQDNGFRIFRLKKLKIKCEFFTFLTASITTEFLETLKNDAEASLSPT
jgi:hypothetical protein